MEYLFVYGTLMLKYPQNSFRELLSKNCEFIGEGTCKGQLYMVSTYPALVYGDSIVFGEVLRVNSSENIFNVLDEYEDYHPNNMDSSLYVRTQIEVSLNNEKSITCWTYIYNKSVKSLLPILSGRFY